MGCISSQSRKQTDSTNKNRPVTYPSSKYVQKFLNKKKNNEKSVISVLQKQNKVGTKMNAQQKHNLQKQQRELQKKLKIILETPPKMQKLFTIQEVKSEISKINDIKVIVNPDQIKQNKSIMSSIQCHENEIKSNPNYYFLDNDEKSNLRRVNSFKSQKLSIKIIQQQEKMQQPDLENVQRIII